jgi:ABC-type antimicrobial peptide transport system permease subunit
VAAQCPAGPGYQSCRQNALESPVLLVGVKPGPAGAAAVAQLSKQFSNTAFQPVTPANLVNFGEAVNFPLILGFVLALFGIATLLHVLVVSVARRRREVRLLKAIGLQSRQVAAAVCWQATTIALVGIVIGVPVGVVAGRAVWQSFASNLGVVPVTVIEVGTLSILAAVVLIVAIVLAIGPALVSARSRPAALLRTE